jgi:tRNA modification GTPase
MTSETIAAISTPPGEGAIALVRMSGPDVISIADGIFRGRERASEFGPHAQHFGAVVDRDGRLVDQVMMSIHRAPESYTGEDLVEISCHGGSLVSAKVLEACLAGGARAARPGEFTERAFLNGKMDLTQAEAVIDLIRAKTDLGLRSANEQLEGRLGEEIRHIRGALIELLAQIEASIDFGEEGIVPDRGEKLSARLDSIRERIAALLATADQGRILREGLRVVIYGATNAGKSSLLNRLLGWERVIVSETHGTTRDTIEETLNLGGIPVRLIDTAGLRSSEDRIERESIARTEKSLERADLRLHIADRNAPKPPHFKNQSKNGDEILVLNKKDLPEHVDWKDLNALRISCKSGEGLGELKNAIITRIATEKFSAESGLAINARHRDCLRRASEGCDRARAAINQQTAPEYVAVEVNEAIRAIGQIIGAVDVEAVLDSVFSQFCIGK